MKGRDDSHPNDHRCRHGTDTDNFAYVGDSLVGSPSNVGFLGVDRIGAGLGPAMILVALLLLGFAIGAGFEGISWPLG